MKKKTVFVVLFLALLFGAALVPSVSADYQPPIGTYLGYIEIHVDPTESSTTYIDSMTSDGKIGWYHGIQTISATVGQHTIYSVFDNGTVDKESVTVKTGKTSVVYLSEDSDGYISISSSPSNAMIYVDGDYMGTTTPYTVTVSGNTTHKVKLVKSGYISQTKSVYVPAGGTSTVSMTLNPSETYGYLSVSSNPSIANIYIDEVYKGQTPMTITLPTGSHTLTLKKSGYSGFSKTVTVYEGATSSVYGVLAEDVTNAYVNITSTPKGASVYIDNEFIGVTPASGYLSKTVKANTNHTLTVKEEGYDSYNSSFSLSTGQIEAFSPTLTPSQPTNGTINITSVPSNASVYIDGEYVGTSPTVQVVSAGTHTVKLACLGYNDSVKSVTVSAGQSYPLPVTMTPGSTPTSTPFPVLGILIGLGAAAVFAGRKLRR